MTLSIRWKATLATLFALVCGFAVAGLLAERSLEQQELAQSSRMLEVRTDLVAFELRPWLSSSPTASSRSQLQSVVRELGTRSVARITVVASDGRVLADSAVSEHSLQTIENHRARPEIEQALATGTGSDLRASHTTGERTLYRAIRVTEDEGIAPVVLRLGLPMTMLEQELAQLRRNLLLAFGSAFLIAVFVSIWLARSLTRPLSDMAAAARRLAAGDPAAHIRISSRDEIGLLADTLNRMADELRTKIDEISEDRSQLRRLEQIRKDFVANVSHELRTPLTSIKGYVEALLDGGKNDPETATKFLDIILKQSDRLNLILEDLLQLSKIESGQVFFKREPLQIGSVIERTLAMIRPLADKKGHRLNVHIAPHLPPVTGDEERLGQVLSNLLDNAIKYTPERGSITVAAHHVPAPARTGETKSDSVEISVTDTGIGIPEQDRPRIFERFYRVDKARSRELGGTGLGLAIVRHIIEGHGGQVWVEGNHPSGSRFVVRLPVQPAGHPATEPNLVPST